MSPANRRRARKVPSVKKKKKRRSAFTLARKNRAVSTPTMLATFVFSTPVYDAADDDEAASSCDPSRRAETPVPFAQFAPDDARALARRVRRGLVWWPPSRILRPYWRCMYGAVTDIGIEIDRAPKWNPGVERERKVTRRLNNYPGESVRKLSPLRLCNNCISIPFVDYRRDTDGEAARPGSSKDIITIISTVHRLTG